MNRDQKSAVIDEIAASITDSSAIFAIDYRGISVEQARELRTRLREADATLRVVKNSLTERAADKAGVEQLKALLQGPTALTFVRGDSALAAKSIADFARVTQLLAFKGGLMDGAAVSPAEITAISRLPSRDVLYGQLTGLVANPLTGLARGLNALLAGLAIQLGGILGQREAAGEKLEAPEPEPAPEAATQEAAPPSEPAEESPQADAPQSGAPEASSEAAEESPTEDAPEEGAAEASSEAAEESPQEAAPESGASGASSEAAEESPSEEAPQSGAPEASSEATPTEVAEESPSDAATESSAD
jgi:large subunit ribosomal protein L10